MSQKRPFDEVSEGVSSKHPRLEEGNQISSHWDCLPSEDASRKLGNMGEGGLGLNCWEAQENPLCLSNAVIPDDTGNDTEAGLPRSVSLSPWAASSTSEDDSFEELFHIPFSPGYFSFGSSPRSTVHPDDLYYLLLDYPPRKTVPVGPDHQADIPEFAPRGNVNASEKNGVENGKELGGICIIPSPLESKPNDRRVGDGRTDCGCPDLGSMKCVRLHIVEEREKLRGILCEETFMNLGFDDMGEVVAEKWSEKDEQLFCEVVYANPASLGKNFWNVLPLVFPSRTKMEIVSYYFNVFMLRQRAKQNRCYPINIDSDDDEWQGSPVDHCDDDKNGGISENEGSAIESPVHPDDLEEDFSDEVQKSDFSFSDKRDNQNYENEAHDGSCTSSDSGAPVQEPTQVKKPDNCEEWHDYVFEPSDTKAWGEYLGCPKNKLDLLPTCSMIEEVFGNGGW